MPNKIKVQNEAQTHETILQRIVQSRPHCSTGENQRRHLRCLALLRAIEAVQKAEAQCSGDERTGLLILRKALEAPTRQIAENSNVDGGVVVDRMRNGAGNWGFDAAKGGYVDLVQAGIIDPTKVVRMALENAVSVAGTLLLTEATLTEIPEPKAKQAVGHGLGEE